MYMDVCTYIDKIKFTCEIPNNFPQFNSQYVHLFSEFFWYVWVLFLINYTLEKAFVGIFSVEVWRAERIYCN